MLQKWHSNATMMPYIALADLCDNVTMCHNVTRLLNSLGNSVVLKYYRRTDSEKYFRSRLPVPHWLEINGAKVAKISLAPSMSRNQVTSWWPRAVSLNIFWIVNDSPSIIKVIGKCHHHISRDNLAWFNITWHFLRSRDFMVMTLVCWLNK